MLFEIVQMLTSYHDVHDVADCMQRTLRTGEFRPTGRRSITWTNLLANSAMKMCVVRMMLPECWLLL